MATPSRNPFYSASTSLSTGTPASSSTQRLALDNLIRRELKVADPNDPMQIAQALMTRYKEDPRAAAIAQEAKGLPFLLSAQAPSVVPQAATSSDAELQQAKDDVERDLQELLTNSLLKDVTPEIQGWAQAVRSATTEGTNAARFALDPRQRDKTFAIRRQLGDYARLARLVGALTPTLNLVYRKFAQSLDEVAAVLLVMMGEALANVGFNGGRYLLQVPYSDLQARRDAVIYALRNLVGSTQQAYGQDIYAWGVNDYRKLFQELPRRGHGDLLALLEENELSRTMDELIQRSAHGSAEGLRQLGATAQLDLERFRRLIIVATEAVKSEYPPLTAFLDTLLLFVQGFDTSGGFRLLRIARPPILFYGLYGIGGLDRPNERLLQLIINRGLLADKLDCFMGCKCGFDEAKPQVLGDKILYDVDRAIDLYAVSSDSPGLVAMQYRAAAYAFVIDSVIDSVKDSFDGELNKIRGLLIPPQDSQNAGPYWDPADVNEFWIPPPNNVVSDKYRDSLIKELCIQHDMESQWTNLVKTMAPNCIGIDAVLREITSAIEEAVNEVSSTTDKIDKSCPELDVLIPKSQEKSQTDISTTLSDAVDTIRNVAGVQLLEVIRDALAEEEGSIFVDEDDLQRLRKGLSTLKAIDYVFTPGELTELCEKCQKAYKGTSDTSIADQVRALAKEYLRCVDIDYWPRPPEARAAKPKGPSTGPASSPKPPEKPGGPESSSPKSS